MQSIIDGLAEVLYRFPFRVPAYYALIARSLTVLEGIAMRSDPSYKVRVWQSDSVLLGHSQCPTMLYAMKETCVGFAIFSSSLCKASQTYLSHHVQVPVSKCFPYLYRVMYSSHQDLQLKDQHIYQKVRWSTMRGFKYSNPFALNNEVAANQPMLMIVRTKDFLSL